MKDQVYIKQRYLTQINKKHDNLEKVLIYIQRMLILLFIAAVRSVSRSPNRSFLLLCGDIEKNPGPNDASKLSTMDDAILDAQKALNFYFSTLVAYRISIKIYQTCSSSWIRKLLL